MFLQVFPFAINTILYLSLPFVLIYLWAQYEYGYWKRKGVFSPPAIFPTGHLGPVARVKISIGEQICSLYEETKHHGYVGLHFLFRKTLLVNDLDLIKNILQKNYDHFEGHGFKSNKETDPLGQNLFNIDGEEWKRIRVKLTPTFTSSKIKYMFETMLSCSDEMVVFLKSQQQFGKNIDVKEVLAKFGTDVIGSCAFGLQMNSFKYPDAEFRRMGKKALTGNFLKIASDILAILSPDILPKLGLKRNYPDVTKFFMKTVKETIEYRDKNNVTRNDFLQLLIDMKNADKNTGNQLTIDEIVPQVYIFFLAGFETSSTVATYALLELAKNRLIQNKVQTQIDQVLEENGGRITYEMIYNMNYLTQIVNESMRLYPPLPFLFRSCTKDYMIPGTKTVIEKGTLIMVSSLGIHRDPEIYPDPFEFDPDRFTPENIAKRHQFTHIPFGEGPRICIGSRFGMMQVKLALYVFLRNFDISLCEHTSLPVSFNPKNFLLNTNGGMVLRLASRKIPKDSK